MSSTHWCVTESSPWNLQQHARQRWRHLMVISFYFCIGRYGLLWQYSCCLYVIFYINNVGVSRNENELAPILKKEVLYYYVEYFHRYPRWYWQVQSTAWPIPFSRRSVSEKDILKTLHAAAHSRLASISINRRPVNADAMPSRCPITWTSILHSDRYWLVNFSFRGRSVRFSRVLVANDITKGAETNTFDFQHVRGLSHCAVACSCFPRWLNKTVQGCLLVVGLKV